MEIKENETLKEKETVRLQLSPERENAQTQRISSNQRVISPERRTSKKLNLSPGKESQKLNISPGKESQKLNISPGKESQKLSISPVRKEPQKMHTSYATAEVNGLSFQKETSKHKSLTMKDEEHKVKKSTEYILERNCNEKPPRKIQDNIKFPENGLRESASLEKGKKQSNENVVKFILT